MHRWFSSWLLLVPWTLLAHDAGEIGATVSLHSNRVELNIIMLRPVIMQAADAQGVHLLDFSRPDERENAMPVLRSQGAGLFVLSVGTNTLPASPVTVTLGQDDHIGFRLSHATPEPRGSNDVVRLDAKVLSHLPVDAGYAVSVTVLDRVNDRVTKQVVLRPGSAVSELLLPATSVREFRTLTVNSNQTATP